METETTFSEIGTVLTEAKSLFSASVPLLNLPAGTYADMRYPKFPAIMRFRFERFAALGFGHVSAMRTRAMFGKMQLATLVFTPSAGTDVPLLLVDVMAFGKKRAAFVEYYDLTAKGADAAPLDAVAEKYRAVPDYPEKPAWYVGERTPYSLIKGGSDDGQLLSMLHDSVAAYAALCAERREAHPENLEKLSAFIERMATDGNPSAPTMEKVLGKAGADRFFREAVMPKTYPDINK